MTEATAVGDRRQARQLLLLGAAVPIGARVVLALTRTGPLAVADEIGYLTNARVLVSGVAGQMGTASFYRGGYSLLIAPLVGLDSDPVTGYRLMLVLNALLAAALYPFLYLLLTRCFRVHRRWAPWSAFAVAAYPTVTAASQVALSKTPCCHLR